MDDMVTSDRRKWPALALLSVVQFMVVLDIAIVNVALPSIQVDLGFSQRNLQWVISAYALVFGGFLLLGGRAADLLGRRRIFLAGLSFKTADGEEMFETGDAYYMPAGHTPVLYAGTEIIEFSPTKELQQTIEVVTKNMEAAAV
jgi:MFS family permease